MIIIGAGMSGLLAGQYFRSSDNVTIWEAQPSLPNNHKALLRFRSNAVSILTGIEFKKVNVSNSIYYEGEHFDKSSLFLNNKYSQKTTGTLRGRSISKLEDCERYIAPDNFISKVSRNLSINYSFDAKHIIHKNMKFSKEPIISTMPVKVLSDYLDYPHKLNLNSRPIWTIVCEFPNMDLDIYQTVYAIDLKGFLIDLYRASITGNKLILEFTEEPIFDSSFDVARSIMRDLFGIVCKGEIDGKIHFQKHGKLVECGDNSVKKFLGWASSEFGIYSLGRWGTHRQILMDDVVKDIEAIDKFIKSDGYIR